MRRLLAALALTLTIPGAARAQAAPEAQAVLAVVDALFDGMRARDTVHMRSQFAEGARMYGLDREGRIRGESIDAWLAGIGRLPEGTVADEVLHEPEVRVDGSIATVWTYYDLFVGERFIHCGYDAIQLVRSAEGWKIVSVLDTRRQEGCRKERTPQR